MIFKKHLLTELKALNRHDIIKKIVSVKTTTNCANVKTLGLSPTEYMDLQKILDTYSEGHFDGMQDMFVYCKAPDKPFSFKYLFIRNEYTDRIYSKVTNILANQWGIIDDATARDRMHVWFNEAIYRIIDNPEYEHELFGGGV